MLSALSAEGVEFTVEGIPVLCIEEFVRNKRASGRPKDRADLILIGRD